MTDDGDGDDLARVSALVRDVPDFPEPGVVFRDITPVLADGAAFTAVSVALAALAGDADLVVGVEARGFLLGAAAALTAGTGIVPIRKAGKLPRVAAPEARSARRVSISAATWCARAAAPPLNTWPTVPEPREICAASAG